ncbi:MAG: hypothetical protein ACP5O1_08085 [Phycisphaerae bacterium]
MRSFRDSSKSSAAPRLASACIIALASMGAAGGVTHAMTITPTFEGTITGSAYAQTIEGDINSALSFYDQSFSNPINVNIAFTITATNSSASYLGQSYSTLYTPNYATYTAYMQANAAANNNAIEQTA